jgi:hypothetical protein
MWDTQVAVRCIKFLDFKGGKCDCKSMNPSNINEQKQMCVEDLLAKKHSYANSLSKFVANHPVPQAERYLRQLPASTLWNLKVSDSGHFLTTKEASVLLNCSPATLFNYKKAGILEPWQRKPRGLIRWPLEELKKISGLN